MDETPLSQTEVKNLRFLRRLVTTLTVTMILGLLAIVSLLVIRFSGAPDAPTLPAQITLPGDSTAIAFTQGPDWFAVVTDGNEILIFSRADGTLLQTVQITN
ncbi:MAG: hypothetical protein KUG69_15005 [Marinosulfonomonas sp.]|nr:hypothetical protein [Marinosulfonomonas sp.]